MLNLNTDTTNGRALSYSEVWKSPSIHSAAINWACRWLCAPTIRDGRGDLLLRPANLRQRGSNDNIIGLIHSREDLDAIVLQLNMRPRKRFDFKCPVEVIGKVMHEAMAISQDDPVSIQ